MPLWASIYMLITFVTCVDSLYDRLKDRERLYYTLLDLAADLIGILMFIAYWYRSLIQSIQSIAPYLFLFSITWWICAWHYDFRRSQRKLTEAQKRIDERFGTYGIFIISSLFVAPCFLFGGLAAFNADWAQHWSSTVFSSYFEFPFALDSALSTVPVAEIGSLRSQSCSSRGVWSLLQFVPSSAHLDCVT